MSRCAKCGEHTLTLKHYETSEPREFDFTPTSSGDFLITDLGYYGAVPEEHRNELLQSSVLFFRAHDCRITLAERQI